MNEDMIKARHKLLLLLKNRPEQIHKNDAEKNRESEPENKLPAVNMGGDVGIAAPNTPPPQARKAYKCFKRTLKIVKEPLEIAAIVGGFIVALLIYLQYREMVSQLDAMRGQLDANLRQAKAAENQLGEMQRQNIIEDRAWVFYYHRERPENISENKDAVTFVGDVRNIGKTPALNVKFVIHWTTNYFEIPTKDDLPPDSKNLGYLVPGAIVTASAGPAPIQLAHDMDNGAVVFVYGTILYDDIFGSNHWTEFSYAITALATDKSFLMSAPTPIHNSCDNMEYRQSQ